MSLRHRFIQGSLSRHASIAFLVASALAAPTTAQDSTPTTGERPASAGRVVRAFDFEEKDYNPLPVPLGWIRAQEDPAVPRVRPGFPIWNGATIDYKSPAYSGIGTARLPTSGGSTSLVLRRGEINIFPNADYLISARVRTENLNFAKARVVARLMDRQGNEIEGATGYTRLANTAGEWEQVSLEIEGIYLNAAFIELELQLLQPREQSHERASDKYTVWDQDFDGSAFFDNLIIAQLPRLEITTATPGNIVESQTPPPISILVRDLTGDEIVARAHIYDVHGKQVDLEILADGSRRVRTDWTPKLPGFGWYRAVLEVSVDEQLVGVRALDFIWASPTEPNHNSGMFGIHTQLTNPTIAQSTPAIIRGTGVTRASAEIWDYHTTKADLDPESIQMKALDELILMDTKLSIVLAELPRELATSLAVDPDEVMPIFAGPIKAWAQWGGEMLDQYGQAVTNWRFGDRATQEDVITLNTQLDAVNEALKGYVPGPMLVTPWAIDRKIEPSFIRPNQQLLIIDDGVTSELAMELVVNDWAQAAAQAADAGTGRRPSLAMMLRPMNETGISSSVEIWSSVGMLARKAISFWWAASSTGLGNELFDLQLSDAWWVSPGKRGQVMPAPELVVWRSLATHLGGRQAIEELDIIPGVRMLVAGPKPGESGDEKDDTGVLILWLDEPGIEERVLNLPLSTHAVIQCDVFNNQTRIEVEHIGELNLPIHRVAIGRSPIIITGINPQLIRFLSAVKLAPNRLQARSGIHRHTLSLFNPWPITIRGQVFIVEPGGYTGAVGGIDRSWEIRPRVFPFVLNPNERTVLPVNIAYSLGEIAGMKKLTFDIELEADTDYPLMRVERQIELSLDGVEMHLTARKGADGITVVSAYVTNKLDINQDYEIIAISPNESRLRRSISGIEPDQQVVREFAFTKAQSGDQIVVALLLRESSVRLNLAVTVP